MCGRIARVVREYAHNLLSSTKFLMLQFEKKANSNKLTADSQVISRLSSLFVRTLKDFFSCYE